MPLELLPSGRYVTLVADRFPIGNHRGLSQPVDVSLIIMFIYLFILSRLTSFSRCGYVDKF
jgi:hypothetical protein